MKREMFHEPPDGSTNAKGQSEYAHDHARGRGSAYAARDKHVKVWSVLRMSRDIIARLWRSIMKCILASMRCCYGHWCIPLQATGVVHLTQE